MKVIFLDIDGCLNSKERWARCVRLMGPEFWVQDRPLIDVAALERLSALVRRTGARVVLSSTWRLTYPLEAIARNLYRLGLPAGCLIGATPATADCGKVINVEIDGLDVEVRGLQIQRWLDEHPEVVAFVILDDMDDMAHLMPRLVQTTWERGLLDEHVERAVYMLGGKDGNSDGDKKRKTRRADPAR